MSKVQGSVEVLNSMQITTDTAGLDKASKDLMKNKEVLAIILKGVVREYADYSYEEIMNFIEGDSITDDEGVTAGRNNPRITGDDKEYAVLGEKTTKRGIYYLARELSVQLSVVTEETDYGKLEKFCMDFYLLLEQ